MLIGSEARVLFSGGAINSILKIVCRYNHHGARNMMINKVRVKDDCPQYIEREFWEHIILCIKNKEIRDKFLFTLKEKLLAIEGMEDVIHEILQMIEDIKNYLNRYDYFITAQNTIGFKNLFRGFVLKDWINAEEQYNKFYIQNEIIVQKCMKHYYDCW